MREFWGFPPPVVRRGPLVRQVPVTFLTSALTEFVTLAAAPGFMHAMGEAWPETPPVAFDDEALALRAIEAGLDDARASGTRAAVCLADLAPADTQPATPEALDAADAWLLPRLRDGDRLYRVGSALVVVASGLGHPRAGEQLAERVRALPVEGGAPSVGLAIYPVHGEDAVTLFGRARASARRDRMQRAAARDVLVS